MRFAAATRAILVLCLSSGLPSAPWPLQVFAPVATPFMGADLVVAAAIETVTLPYDLVAKPESPSEAPGKRSCEEVYPPKRRRCPHNPFLRRRLPHEAGNASHAPRDARSWKTGNAPSRIASEDLCWVVVLLAAQPNCCQTGPNDR